MLENNYIALILTFIIAIAWLRINDFTAHRGWVGSRLSRKIIHIGTGPIFVLCWLLFTNVPSARYLAATVPLMITLQFILVGLGIIQDKAAVQAMSRTGDRREILRGPLYYGLVFVLATILFWHDSPTGIVALMLMCGGDGLADVVGNRYGAVKLPWNKGKSWAGSAGMFFGGWIFAAGILAVFQATGALQNSFVGMIPAITVITFVATLVESLPLRDIDNITITLVAVIIGWIIW